MSNKLQPSKKRYWGKKILFVFFAFILGFFGLSLLFSDLGPGETATSRLVTTALFFLISGFIIGVVNSIAWRLSGFVAWGGILLGVSGALSLIPNGAQALSALGIALGALGLALLGGYLGALVVRKRVIPQLASRLLTRR